MTRLQPLTLFSASVALLLRPLSVSADRTIRVVNNCDVTIWPGLFSAANPPANTATGWEAPPGDERDISIPVGWIGRIWPRTECDFSRSDNPAEQCTTGGCNGGLECSNPGVPPATLAEFTIEASDGQDWYDVSLVDGFNVPMTIENSAGCVQPDCTANINSVCPQELQIVSPVSGQVVGCKSDCLVDPNPTNSPSCCSGQYSTPQTCPNSGVPHYSTFKDACPNAYAYAYDESSGTALWTCAADKQADYTVVFCPAGGASAGAGSGSGSGSGLGSGDGDTAGGGAAGSLVESSGAPAQTVTVTLTVAAEGGDCAAPTRLTKRHQAIIGF